tara:strand:+ start:4308 stop:4685 length:378 start_codon:yes stop_codon:yes gene_type:complete
MDNNIIQLDYDKIEKLIKLAKEEDLNIIKKSKKKISLKNKKKIMKSLKIRKKKKIMKSKKELNGGMNSLEIIKINNNLINNLKKLEDIESSLSTIDDDIITNYPINYCDFSSDSSSEEFIEIFMN